MSGQRVSHVSRGHRVNPFIIATRLASLSLSVSLAVLLALHGLSHCNAYPTHTAEGLKRTTSATLVKVFVWRLVRLLRPLPSRTPTGLCDLCPEVCPVFGLSGCTPPVVHGVAPSREPCTLATPPWVALGNLKSVDNSTDSLVSLLPLHGLLCLLSSLSSFSLLFVLFCGLVVCVDSPGTLLLKDGYLFSKTLLDEKTLQARHGRHSSRSSCSSVRANP